MDLARLDYVILCGKYKVNIVPKGKNWRTHYKELAAIDAHAYEKEKSNGLV